MDQNAFVASGEVRWSVVACASGFK